MNQTQLKIILFFVRRGLNISQACHRIGQDRNKFYVSTDRKLIQTILDARLEMKALLGINMPYKLERMHDYLLNDLDYNNLTIKIESYIGNASTSGFDTIDKVNHYKAENHFARF